MHTNNVGDPYHDSNLLTHTKPLERAVLDYYANLWGAKPHHEDKHGVADPNSAWGYVLSMGSSEGNVYGLLNARDYLSGQFLMTDSSITGGMPQMVLSQAPPDAERPHAYEPVIFFSADTHYSVAKAAHTLAIPTFGRIGNERYPGKCPLDPAEPWPVEVPSKKDGSIDVKKLVTLAKFFAKRGYALLFVLNLGSTYRGAYDDVQAVVEGLRPILTNPKYNLTNRVVQFDPEDPSKFDVRNGYWIHIDGALGATYLPFLKMAQEGGLEGISAKPEIPTFDFSVPEVSSIVTSGHKYPGAPWACGIYMTKSGLQLKPPGEPGYIGSPDTTFGGSRNAFSAIVLWNFIAKHSNEEQVRMIARCVKLAAHTVKRLQKVDARLVKLGHDRLRLTRSPNSLSLVFRQPNSKIVERFSLSNVTLAEGKLVVDFSHIYIMPHVDEDLIDELVRALMADGAFPKRAARDPDLPKPPDLHPALEDAQPVFHIDMNRGFA